MQPIPDNIIKFLHANHVISIAAAADGEIWSSCCFYVPDEAQARLIVLTSARSKHGSLMLKIQTSPEPSQASRKISPKSTAYS